MWSKFLTAIVSNCIQRSFSLKKRSRLIQSMETSFSVSMNIVWIPMEVMVANFKRLFIRNQILAFI